MLAIGDRVAPRLELGDAGHDAALAAELACLRDQLAALWTISEPTR